MFLAECIFFDFPSQSPLADSLYFASKVLKSSGAIGNLLKFEHEQESVVRAVRTTDDANEASIIR
jgi:hypothetical protein